MLLFCQQPVQSCVLLLGPLRGTVVFDQLSPLTRHNPSRKEPLAYCLCELVPEDRVPPHQEAQTVVVNALLHRLPKEWEHPVCLQSPHDLHLHHVHHVGDLECLAALPDLVHRRGYAPDPPGGGKQTHAVQRVHLVEEVLLILGLPLPFLLRFLHLFFAPLVGTSLQQPLSGVPIKGQAAPE